MIRRPPRSTQSRSSAASDVYKRQSPACPASSPPTTMPSAACAGRSSCASSRTAASLLRGSAPSNGCSRPRSPAACRGARSSSTSLRSSAPGSAATPFRCSPDSAGDQLNAYIIRALCRGILLPRAPGRPADGGLDELERLKVDEAPRCLLYTSDAADDLL